MARVTGPFMSLDASGTIFGTLTASIWKGRNYIRGYAIPSNPNSAAQQAQRAIFAAAVALWQSLPATTPEIVNEDYAKDVWNEFGSACQPPMSGFNAFVKAYCEAGNAPAAVPSSPYAGSRGIR